MGSTSPSSFSSTTVEVDACSSAAAAAEGKTKANAETQRAQSNAESESIGAEKFRRIENRRGKTRWRAKLAATKRRKSIVWSLRAGVTGTFQLVWNSEGGRGVLWRRCSLARGLMRAGLRREPGRISFGRDRPWRAWCERRR